MPSSFRIVQNHAKFTGYSALGPELGITLPSGQTLRKFVDVND